MPGFEAHFKRVSRLCKQYNQSEYPEDATLISRLGQSHERLAAIVGHLGNHSYARAPFSASMGCNISIGDNVFLNSE